MQANKLALSTTLLVLLGMIGLAGVIVNIIVDKSICWEACILIAVCYGFIMIQTNQLNIHSIEHPDK